LSSRVRILFLCTGNSCRSQMAEGWAKQLKGDVIEPYSAGIEPCGLDPIAVKIMAEVGVDISRHKSKHFSEFKDIIFDYIITICDDTYKKCPVFPGRSKTFHVGFDDPPHLARQTQSEKEALDVYRRVRDEIRDFVNRLPESLK
jgi:arsenate reductase